MIALKGILRAAFEAVTRSVKAVYWFALRIAYSLGILDEKRIPVIINNYNRLTFPLQLIASLEKRGYSNIVFLDNNSTYQPLLQYYDMCPYRVIREKFNYGHLALWKSRWHRHYRWNYFVYTDPDVVLDDACPPDFISTFRKVLDSRYYLDKVGFGIRIDDLPDTFSLKPDVVAYEQQYWKRMVGENLYDAPVDTTFALYKPFSGLKNGEVYTLSGCRMGPPYIVRHLPWYVDSENLSEEERYYRNTANTSSSIRDGMVYANNGK